MRLISVKRTLTAMSLATFAVVTMAAGQVHAVGGTATWTDATGDHKFSTAGNWAENAIPVAGDVLTFNTLPAGVSDPYNIINDVDVQFAGVSYTGGQLSSPVSATMQNDLNLAPNAVWNVDYKKDFNVGFVTNKHLVANGNLTLQAGELPFATTFIGGIITAKSGTSILASALGKGEDRVVIENGAMLMCLSSGVSITYTTPITLGGGTSTALPVVALDGCGPIGTGKEVVLADVTLQGNAEASVGAGNTLKITKITTNGHTIGLAANSDGAITAPSGVATQTYTQKTTTLDGAKPTEDYVVLPKEIATLNGSRCHVVVRTEGVLMGQGTLCSLAMSTGSTLSPGHSPGVITVTGTAQFSAGSTYVAEIASKTSYDKLVASDIMAMSGSLTLDLRFLDGATVAAGDSYTLIEIKNATSGIADLFKGLPEGATFTAAGGTFKITYKGGDGNDIVVTVVSVPKVPNTGFALVKTSPALIAGVAVVLAIVLLGVGRFAATRR